MIQSSQIKISIVTVCKNSEKYLEETIKSVTEQTYSNIEYIIIDGNSSDSTVEIIRKYEQRLAYWTSAADKNMYDGINKGLDRATGDYILVLNSDDVLVNSTVIQNVVSLINRNGKDYYYGNIVKLKDNLCKKVKLFDVNFEQLLLSTHGTFAPHPCFFISSKLNSKLKGYNTDYYFASDYDYILRALSFPNVQGSHIDIYITKFRIHNLSITASGKINNERVLILLNHGFGKYNAVKKYLLYYFLWIYYKAINMGHRFRKDCI